MNKNIKIIVFSIIIAIIVTALFGIIVHNFLSEIIINNDNKIINKQTTPIYLTEKQKEILRKEGLSDNYEKLTSTQKSGIIAIGQFIDYLEQTYDENFKFEKYFMPTMLYSSEYATFTCEHGTINVYRKYEDNKYVYWDNHDEIINTPKYREALIEFFSQYMDKDKFKIYSKISNLEDNYLNENIISSASASSIIFISDQIDEERFNHIVDDYSNWIKENHNKHSSLMTFYLFKDEVFDNLNEFNYRDIITNSNEVLIKKVNCSLSVTGNMNRY